MRSQTTTLFAALAFAASCSSDPGVAPTLEVNIFGWDSASGFVSGMPAFDDAQSVTVKVTQPLDHQVITQETYAAGARNASLPDVTFGDDLRMDFEVLDSAGSLIAAGSTPRFDFEPERQLLSFRVQVTKTNSFSPVGNVVVDRTSGDRKFAWTQLDYRGKGDVTWLGRSGHATAPTSDGRILVVGGGDPLPGSAASNLPEYRSVYDDVQIFDPETGYFSDLAFDDSSGAVLAEGKDRLFEPVVFHTLTPIGDDRFLIVGGFTPRSDVMRPVNTIQVIDLNAPAGTRVQRLVDADGSSLVLQKARGWHTANYRSIDDHVVVAGGIGPQGADDVLATFEMIDLASSAVYPEAFPLSQARAQHSAVLMGDARSIWLIGGRDASTVTASTEVIKLNDAGTTEAAAEGNMRTPRFGLGAVRVTPGGGDLVLVAGGFTDLDGAVDDSFEVSKLGRGAFETGTNWKLSTPRGGITAIELPQSNDIALIGGRDAASKTVATAEVLEFADLASDPPYAAQVTSASATPRYLPSVDLLSNGRILLVGGEGEDAGLDTADYFNPTDRVGGDASVVVVTE